MNNDFDDIEEQAKLCEQANRFAMASILWRRINCLEEAIICETILTILMKKEKYVLIEHNPVILKRLFR